MTTVFRSNIDLGNAARWATALVGMILAGVSTAQQPEGAGAARPSLAKHEPDVPPVSLTTAELMAHPNVNRPRDPSFIRPRKNLTQPDRDNLPLAPGSLLESQWPRKTNSFRASSLSPAVPQTVSTVFDTIVGPTETGGFPADTMGAIGPSQFVLFVNGRLRTFSRSGVADGVINIDPEVFFSSVTTPPGPQEVVTTLDPAVRYDRLSGRWFLMMMDAVFSTTTGALSRPNRLLIAVSDAERALSLRAPSGRFTSSREMPPGLPISHPSGSMRVRFTSGPTCSLSRVAALAIRKGLLSPRPLCSPLRRW